MAGFGKNVCSGPPLAATLPELQKLEAKEKARTVNVNLSWPLNTANQTAVFN